MLEIWYKEWWGLTDRAEFAGDEAEVGLKLEDGWLERDNEWKDLLTECDAYIDSGLSHRIYMVHGLIEITSKMT